MRYLLFSIPILLLQAYSGQAQLANSIIISAVEYNDSPKGAPLTHFTVQVDVRPATGAGYTVTQECDSFCIFDDLPKGSTLVFTAAKEDLPDDHVGTYDLVIISRHINKEVFLDHPSRLLAADADCNRLIEPKDIVILRNLILRFDTSFCQSWMLLDASVILPANPWQAPLPREIVVDNYDGGRLELQFWAIKTGNVNGFFPEKRVVAPPPGVFVGAPQPNPTAEGVQFAVQLEEAVTLHLDVFDALGQNIYTAWQPAQAGAQQLDLPAGVFPAAGVYFWRMVAGDEKASGKIVRR
jgi:hypothetical protein